MYVAPNSTIILLENVPLDSTYTDTVLFTTKSGQATAFRNYTKYEFTAQSYQRVGRNKCRLQVPYNSVYGCNYMMFQNTSYGTKWWYAFIDHCEYVNNATTEITYRLDPIQNWITDWTLKPCFVERNHVTDDSIGANIVPESVACGARYTSSSVSTMPKGEQTLDPDNIKCYYVFAGYNQDEHLPTGGSPITVLQGIPTGYSLYKFRSSELDLLNAWLKDLTEAGYIDTIIGIYCFYGAYDGTDGGTPDEPQSRLWQLNDSDFGNLFIQNIHGYTPRNNKLFTYPYNCIRVDNGNGDSAEYRYEFFSKDASGNIDPLFDVYGCISCPPEMFCLPHNYLGDTGESYGDGIGLRGFPQVPFTIDGFRAWIAQNGLPTTLSIAGSLLGIAGGLNSSINSAEAANARAMAGANLANELANTYSQYPTVDKQGNPTLGYSRSLAMYETRANQTPSIVPDYDQTDLDIKVIGSIIKELEVPIQAKQSCAGASSILYAMDFMEFQAFQECISAEMASVIDSYFDRFGYAINKLQTPNINARTHFTYIKTKGCKIGGAIPNDDRRTIEQIMDNGITFWKNLSEVGNYSTSIISANAL